MHPPLLSKMQLLSCQALHLPQRRMARSHSRVAGSVAGWLDQLPGSESLAGGLWRTRVEGANLDGESFVAKKAAKPWRKDDGAPSHWLTASMTTSIGRDFLELSFVLDECSGKVYMVDSSTGWWQDALELGWEDADLSIKMHHQQIFRGTMRYKDVQKIWDSLDIDSYGAYGHWRATMKVKRQDFSASDHQSVCFTLGSCISRPRRVGGSSLTELSSAIPG